MQLNHLKQLRTAILSWLQRSSKSCIMKNEGFNLNNGSQFNSHNSVGYFNGHGISYAMHFQSEGQWSNDFNKEFWLTIAPMQARLSGYNCEAIPRILVAGLLQEVNKYLPLPEWTEKAMVIAHWKNTFDRYDEEGNALFLSESEWSTRYDIGGGLKLKLLEELKYQGALNGIETTLSDEDIINSDLFLEEFNKYQIINGEKTGEYPKDGVKHLVQMLTGKRLPKKPLRKQDDDMEE